MPDYGCVDIDRQHVCENTDILVLTSNDTYY